MLNKSNSSLVHETYINEMKWKLEGDGILNNADVDFLQNNTNL